MTPLLPSFPFPPGLDALCSHSVARHFWDWRKLLLCCRYSGFLEQLPGIRRPLGKRRFAGGRHCRLHRLHRAMRDDVDGLAAALAERGWQIPLKWDRSIRRGSPCKAEWRGLFDGRVGGSERAECDGRRELLQRVFSMSEQHQGDSPSGTWQRDCQWSSRLEDCSPCLVAVTPERSAAEFQLRVFLAETSDASLR